MGIYDREYTQSSRQGPSWGGPGGMRFGLPKLTTAVKWLLIINVAVFLIEVISGQMEVGARNYFEEWGAVFPQSWAYVAQVWRLISYQFLHGGLQHILFNMLGLYFLGPRLEAFWGIKKFLTYYLLCGVAAGLLYTLLAMSGILDVGTLVGASGSILAILAACAILFPGDIIFLLFFPLPIRIAALVLIGIFIFLTFTGGNRGGNAAHLGGMAAGAAYIWLWPKLGNIMTGRRRSAWDRKMEQQRRLQLEVDRILDKVHDQGLASLSRKEKKMLQEATRLEQTKRRTNNDW
jgi:membrane associated rhomboid family serine protease